MPGAKASSEERICENARPIHSSAGSPERFSQRSTAIRGGADDSRLERPQPASRRGRMKSWCRLQNTRLQGHQLLEFGQLAKSFELGILQQLLLLFEAFLQRLADVLQGAIVHPRLGVRLGKIEVELGPLLDAALFQQHA